MGMAYARNLPYSRTRRSGHFLVDIRRDGMKSLAVIIGSILATGGAKQFVTRHQETTP